MPVDFVDRLEEQLREAAAVPPAVHRRRRLVAAARPAVALAATAALAAGAVGAVAAGSGDPDTMAGTAAGERSAPTGITERPPVPRPAPSPRPLEDATPAPPGARTTPGRTPTAPGPPASAPAVPPPAPATPGAPGPALAVPAPRPPATVVEPAPAPERPGVASPLPATPASPAPVPLAPARGPWVAVLNGTTSAGLARRVAGVVAGLGYRSLPSGNAAVADVPRTTLYATAGNVTAARALAATLGVRIAVARMTREVAAVSPRAGITVVLGRTPAPPDEVSSLRLTGPFGAAGVASFVRRDNGTVALSLRTSRVARGSYLVGWVPGAGGWTRMGNVPLPRTSGWPTVIEPVGRTLPEGFLLTAETAGAQPARPGRTVLTSRR